MRGYFIESAKNLLKGEGLRSISVRHVAEHAGYSYATMYNYFKNLNELIFVCVEDFQREAEEIIKAKTENTPGGREKIAATAGAFVEYFTEYPGVFELFFIEKMNSSVAKQETSELIYTFLDRLSAREWDALTASGEVSDEDAAKMKDALRFCTAGALLLYENRNKPESYSDFVKTLKTQINFILGI